MGFLDECCSSEVPNNSQRSPRKDLQQCPTPQTIASPKPVSIPCSIPDVNFPRPFVDASPVAHSLVAAGSHSYVPGECLTKIDGATLKSEFNCADSNDIIEQGLALEEEELRLKRKRLTFAKLTGSTSNVKDYINCAGIAKQDSIGTIEESLRRLTLGIGLPKLEIDPFSGCASDYVTFISSFHSQISSQVSDPYQKLCYLVYYCRGVAKEAIKHCTLLPEETCFDTAMGILKSQFGRPHQIIQSVTQDLFTGPPIRGTDQQSLTCLLRQMRCCQITLSQLNRCADLNCTTNLSKVVRRLPKPLQIKWAEIAETLLSIGKEVTFDDLLTLVERRVAMGSTDYGIIAFEEPIPRTSQQARRVATAISSHASPSCSICNQEHVLNICPTFVNMNVSERWEALKKYKSCFRCLRSNHRIRDCKSKMICGVNGYSKTHHRLLHMDRDTADRLDVNVSGRICNSYNPLSTKVHLGFVPVRIEGKNGLVCTYAFLDNGSDCTLIDQTLVKELGLHTVPRYMSVSTLHGLRKIKCNETRAKLSSLDRTYSVDLNPLIAVDRLPMHEVDRAPDVSKWPHLSDVSFSSLNSKRVGLLIGCDLPQIHEVLDQRLGSNEEPFAFKSKLGWILRGPTGSSGDSALRINAIVSEPSVEDLIHRLYNNEFQDGENFEDLEPSINDLKALGTVKASAKLVEGHYELAVPWKSTDAHLPDNYNLAVRRLDGLKRKLLKDETLWPRHSGFRSLTEEFLEVKRVAVISTYHELEWFKNIVDRCSNWITLLRRVVWLRRFKTFIRIKTKAQLGLRIRIGNIKPDELDMAKEDIFRLCQRQEFTQGDRSIVLKSLKPIMANGIICLGGRVANIRQRQLPILPANCRITDLIVDHFHRIEGHSGASHVLATLRSTYWLIKGMATVRRNIRKCFQCRTLWAQPCRQAMADLPPFRIDEGYYPFQHCGLDYFGPFLVTYGRKHVKRFGCLFTCMQTRAVHIEVAHDLSTDSFLMSLTRFICRRGSPTNIYSDNGSNFIGAEKELRSMLGNMEQKSIVDNLSLRGVNWHFNPPYASHRGGCWERIIRSVRRILTNIIQDQVVTDEVLLTSFAEVERILNDRPLAPVYDDPDHPIALRPSDLLLFHPNPGSFDDSIPLRERFTRKWRQAQHLANVFWKRWKREYLPTLQQTHKWLKVQRNLRIGDLVLLSKMDTPRGQWPKGVVCEIFPGPDGLVRQVSVRTGSGVVRRDIRSLCLLEGAEE